MATHTSSHHEAKKEEEKKEVTKSPEYIEIRIPRFTKARVPFLAVLLLMGVSFVGGYVAHQALAGSATFGEQAAPISDVPSAFTYYAKKIGLDEKKFSSCYTASKFLSSVDADIKDGTAAGVNATPSFFINGQPLVGALPIDMFKQIIEHELTGAPLPTPGPSETPPPAQSVAKGHLPVLGNETAKVTIVEFSDFQCPFCERFFSDTYPELKKEYIDTGKVAFYYRHFPLTNIHPDAKPAALAAECANEQGKFWQYHDVLFKNQSVWVNLPQSTTAQ